MLKKLCIGGSFTRPFEIKFMGAFSEDNVAKTMAIIHWVYVLGEASVSESNISLDIQLPNGEIVPVNNRAGFQTFHADHNEQISALYIEATDVIRASYQRRAALKSREYIYDYKTKHQGVRYGVAKDGFKGALMDRD